MVRWIIRRDKRATFRFASLQGAIFAGLSVPGKPTDLSTLVLYDGLALRLRSDATIAIFREIGGVWGLLAIVIGWEPRWMRDTGYRWFSKTRRWWMGSKQSCELAEPGVRERMLD